MIYLLKKLNDFQPRIPRGKRGRALWNPARAGTSKTTKQVPSFKFLVLSKKSVINLKPKTKD
jgi:hypothetical protein